MPYKYLNKYRIQSTRLREWDYKNAAAYFITICTHNRQHHFGEVYNRKMHLSPIGKIVEIEWLKTPDIRIDMNLELDEFVVMPNHFHGILIIGDNQFNKSTDTRYPNGFVMSDGRDGVGGVGCCRDAMHGVSTGTTTSTSTTVSSKNQFGPQLKNLGSIVRGFKSAVTNQVKKMHVGDGVICRGRGAKHGVSTQFAWQPRFHDHIIRDAQSFNRIRQYIANNPLNWRDDKFYAER